jgi:upstream activation factor subunit UAF30
VDGAAPKLNGFTKPITLSPEMAAWMGAPTASRPAVTKHLWQYIKERDLQDPANKQFVLADDTLRALTGEAKFKAFSFGKLAKKHFLGYAD